MKLARAVEEEGNQVVYLPVTQSGNLDPAQKAEALAADPTLISVMAANNETGILFPFEEIAAEAKSKGILFHTDAVQAVGKIPFSFCFLCQRGPLPLTIILSALTAADFFFFPFLAFFPEDFCRK